MLTHGDDPLSICRIMKKGKDSLQSVLLSGIAAGSFVLTSVLGYSFLQLTSREVAREVDHRVFILIGYDHIDLRSYITLHLTNYVDDAILILDVHQLLQI